MRHIKTLVVVFCSFFFATHVIAVTTSPGHKKVSNQPVTIKTAQEYFRSVTETESQALKSGLMSGDVEPEIAELTRGLKNDPDLIYQFVRNHIRYSPIYGLVKGPFMTLMDKEGNDFDQSSLMIALLRQAGYTASYMYGTIRLSPSQITNWLGVPEDANVIGYLLGSAGIPSQVYVYSNQTIAYVDVAHVWVKVNIGGTDYVFDPSFKVHQYISGINLQSATGYNQSSFLSSVTSGATTTSDYVQNLNTANLQGQFNSYSGNLINYIHSNIPAATLAEVVGGREITPSTGTLRQTTLPYQQSVSNEWTDIPSAYKVSLRIQYQGIDQILYSCDIAGLRLTLFSNSSNQPQLILDGEILQTGSATTPGTNQDMTLTVNHPYAANGGTYCDDSQTLTIQAGGSYVVVNGWANSGTDIIGKHRKSLAQNKFAGGSDSCEPVLGESLSILGTTWLAECCRSDEICDKIADTSTIQHHQLGVCGQNESPYIDMPMCLVSAISHTSNTAMEEAVFFATSGHASAFEWGVIEQLQSPKTAVSTVKLIDMSHSKSDKIFNATDTNYWGTVKAQLINYDSWELSYVEAYINAGYRVILPQDGNLGEGDWQGIGFMAVSQYDDQIGHIISGGLSGGFGIYEWLFSGVNTLIGWFSGNHAQSSEPIDLVTGDYLYDHTDLTIGSGSYPFRLSFGRSYNSDARLEDGPLGLGWTHNLAGSAKAGSDGFEGLGKDSPLDASAAIVETLVTLDLLKTSKGNTNLTISTLAHRWRMDQLINNTVTIQQGNSTSQFVKLPNGLFNPPPGKADTLTKDDGGAYHLRSKHGDYLDFDSNGRLTAWRDPNNVTVSYSYDGTGRLSQVQNPFNRSISLTYNGNHIDYLTDSAGRVVDFTYDSTGHLTAVMDPNGCTTNFAYGSAETAGQLRQVYYPAHSGQSYVTNVYDDLGRVKTQTDGAGNTYQYYYSGYRAEETDPNSNSKIYTFNDDGRQLSQTDAAGNIMYNQYDGLQRTTQTTSPWGDAITYAYDNNHNILNITHTPKPGSTEPSISESFTYESTYNRALTHTDPKGNATAYSYFANGKLQRINQPQVSGQIPRTQFTYNAYGQIETITDAEGKVSKYAYDPATGDLLQTIVDYGVGPEHLNLATSFTYDNAGNMLTTTDPRGNTTIFSYDADRRPVSVTAPAPLGFVTEYQYDRNGNLSRLRRSTENLSIPWQTTSYTYTTTDKISTVTDPDGKTTTYQYNNLQWLWKVTDAENNTTEQMYDSTGRLWKIIDAKGHASINKTYDQNGTVKTLKDANGNITTYEYDDFGRLKKTIYPDTSYEQLGYDPAGNVVSRRTRSGQTIGFIYDALNRPTIKTPPDTGIIQYGYDLVGRLTSVVDQNGTITHTYDNVGRLSGVTYPGGKSISYQYDTGGNCLRLTYPDGTYVNFDYDPLNRLTDIRNPDSSVIAHYDYDALSRRTSVQYANGTSASYAYNIADRLLNLNNQMTSTGRSFTYTYDNVGNRLTMTDNSGLHQYAYDRTYQLTGVDYPAGYFTNDASYVFDPAGNRDYVTSGTTIDYTANTLNQYTAVGPATYFYDGNGNLTNDGTNSYVYDTENRLTSATTPANNATYKYDPFGRRISKTVNGAITQYLYDGDRIICEYDGSDKLLRKFVYGTGIDEAIRMTNVLPSADIAGGGNVDLSDFAVMAQVWLLDSSDPGFNPDADLVADNVIDLQDLTALADSWHTDGSRSEDYYYHYDGLGSVIALSNAAGQTAEAYHYDVYGRADSGSAVGNPYLFTGRQYDPESGLYYYRARMYNPQIGRFLQTDPVRYLDNMNLYVYVQNNPLKFIDPMGLCKDGKARKSEQDFLDYINGTKKRRLITGVGETDSEKWKEFGYEEVVTISTGNKVFDVILASPIGLPYYLITGWNHPEFFDKDIIWDAHSWGGMMKNFWGIEGGNYYGTPGRLGTVGGGEGHGLRGYLEGGIGGGGVVNPGDPLPYLGGPNLHRGKHDEPVFTWEWQWEF